MRITTSAYNAQVKGGTQSYYEAIQAYKYKFGEYPKTQPELDGDTIAMTCLGIGYKDQYCGRVIEYAVHGEDQDCGISSAWAYSSSSGATACEILLEEF